MERSENSWQSQFMTTKLSIHMEKSMKENTKDVFKYEYVMAEVNATYGKLAQNTSQIDWTTQNPIEDQRGESSNTIDLDYGI